MAGKPTSTCATGKAVVRLGAEAQGWKVGDAKRESSSAR